MGSPLRTVRDGTTDVVERRLREVDALKAELIAVVSHEFRTPLTAIMGYAHTLRTRVHELDAEHLQFCTDRIEEQAHRLARLVANLLVAADEPSPDPNAATDVGVLTARVVDELLAEGIPIAHEIPVVLTADPGVVVRMAAEHVAVVVSSLIDNALKFAEGDREVAIVLRLTAATVTLEVTNASAPIPPQERERIFGAFEQLDSSDTRAHNGLGLGLYLVRKVVDAHDGCVKVRCHDGLVTFHVELPAVSAHEDVAIHATHLEWRACPRPPSLSRA